jgi:hypothetical protein
MDSTSNRTSPTRTLATPTAIQCDRCRLARSQAVMARVRHVAGREKSEWACPECAAVWAFASNSAVEFVPRVISALRPSICPCPLGGPLEVAREMGRSGSAHGWLWVCTSCGAGHPLGRIASA